MYFRVRKLHMEAVHVAHLNSGDPTRELPAGRTRGLHGENESQPATGHSQERLHGLPLRRCALLPACVSDEHEARQAPTILDATARRPKDFSLFILFCETKCQSSVNSD